MIKRVKLKFKNKNMNIIKIKLLIIYNKSKINNHIRIHP